MNGNDVDDGVLALTINICFFQISAFGICCDRFLHGTLSDTDVGISQ